MKKNLFILFMAVIALCSCEPHVIVPPGSTITKSDTTRVGYRSIISYKYMQYTADSALLKIAVEEREDATASYTHAELTIGGEPTIVADSLPMQVEMTIPIIDDSTILVKHLCWVDTLDSVMYKEPLLYEVQVHKGEIINHNPDTVASYFYNIELISTISVSTSITLH